MDLLLKMLLISACFSFTISSVYADEKKDTIIDQVIETYGGENLIKLKSLKLIEKYKSFRYGQSYRPDEVDINHNLASVTLDITNQRKSFRWVRGLKPNFSTQHQVFDGKNGYSIDHTAETLTANDNISYISADRQHLFQLDTALVLLLNEFRHLATYEGEENYRGELQHKINLKAQGLPQLSLFIDQENNRIVRMQRPYWQPGQSFNYHYSGYQTEQNILYATNTYVTRGGQPFNVSVASKIEINPDVSQAFVIPDNYKEEAASIDFSEMSVNKVADNIYLAGNDWGFSIFINTGNYYAAAGGYEGLTERFNAVKKFSGIEQPLKYLVVSHHHADHLGGMQEAAELGADFITVQENIKSIRLAANIALADDRFLILEGSGTFDDGAIKVLDFPNGHAQHNLMTYLPSGKIIFTADFYFSRQHSGSPDGYASLKSFASLLNSLNYDVQYLAAAHSGRILTKADLDSSIKEIGNVSEEVCPADWEICAD